MKAFDESYSKIIRGHKYKDEDNGKDNDKDKYTDKVPEKPPQVTLVRLFRSYNQFYRAECITVSGFFNFSTTHKSIRKSYCALLSGLYTDKKDKKKKYPNMSSLVRCWFDNTKYEIQQDKKYLAHWLVAGIH